MKSNKLHVNEVRRLLCLCKIFMQTNRERTSQPLHCHYSSNIFIHTVSWVSTRAIIPAVQINSECAEDVRFLSYIKCSVCLLRNYWNRIWKVFHALVDPNKYIIMCVDANKFESLKVDFNTILFLKKGCER